MIFYKIKMWYIIDLFFNMKDFFIKERLFFLSVKVVFDRRRWMRRIEWDERFGLKLDNLKVKVCVEECVLNVRFSLLSNYFKVSIISYYFGRYVFFDLLKLDLYLSIVVNGGLVVVVFLWLGMKYLVFCRFIYF